MDLITLPFLGRGRKFGYIIWRKQYDFEMRLLMGQGKKIEVVINDRSQGIKNIDWKNRRIPITYTVTRNLSRSTSKILLKLDTKKRLIVTFSD